MTLLNPSAFYLLFASFLVLLLHFLRARERRRSVSALSLWDGLPGDPQSRAARLRQQLDPLLLIQLAALLALVAALAQPAWRARTASLSGLAIVLDGSASMRTVTEDGSTRYERAIDEALTLLERTPADVTALVQFSSHPTILARPSRDAADLPDILRASEPTWYGDGQADTLVALLGSLGETSRFERVVVLSDRAIAELPTTFESILVAGGENLAMTGFSVRQNPDGTGVSAFVSASNNTNRYQDATIRIDDRENQTTLAVLMEPGAAETFVIPFPNSSGTLFTATLDPNDDFPADNRRFFALDRALDVRVHWIGSENRYLMAALEAVAPVSLVDAPADADLTVVHSARAPASLVGTILLVHGGIEDLLVQVETRPTETVDVLEPDHSILRGVDPTVFRIREAPTASLPPSAVVVLESAGIPLLVTYEDSVRSIVYIAPSILDTNLPVTIDFPLLIRNVVSGIVRLPSELSYRSADIGEAVSLAGRGAIEQLFDPREDSIGLPSGLTTFRPAEPGFYTLVTDRGAFAIAANVSAGESSTPAAAADTGPPVVVGRDTVEYLPLWPVLAALAILLLLVEAYVHVGRRRLMGRAR